MVEHHPDNIGKPDTSITPIVLPSRKRGKYTSGKSDIQTLEASLNNPTILAGLSMEEVSMIRGAINQLRVL
jgi:hypothetical protein